MRILLVFSSSELGGAERSLTRMAMIPRDDVTYVLATLDGPGPWVEWCFSLGIVPVVLGRREASGSHGRFGLGALFRLLSFVRREGFSVLYVIGLRASLMARLAKPFLKGARVVHGVRWNPNSTSRLDRAFRIAERLLSFLVDLYICNSRVASETLQRRVGISSEKIRIIYNGLERLPPDICFHRPQHVVVLANLSPRKGHSEFLDIVASVCKEIPSAHFFFVGRDDMNGRIAAEIKHLGLARSVTLTGYQPDVTSWLTNSRVMVLPSVWGEGCPTSILEGQAHGLPIVAYAIDGVPELVIDRVDGVLVSPGDVKAFALAIRQFLEDPILAKRMGAAGREKVEEQFTLTSCAALHDSAFFKLLVAEKAVSN